jgi:hypothetical protein
MVLRVVVVGVVVVVVVAIVVLVMVVVVVVVVVAMVVMVVMLLLLLVLQLLLVLVLLSLLMLLPLLLLPVVVLVVVAVIFIVVVVPADARIATVGLHVADTITVHEIPACWNLSAQSLIMRREPSLLPSSYSTTCSIVGKACSICVEARTCSSIQIDVRAAYQMDVRVALPRGEHPAGSPGPARRRVPRRGKAPR